MTVAMGLQPEYHTVQSKLIRHYGKTSKGMGNNQSKRSTEIMQAHYFIAANVLSHIAAQRKERIPQ